MKLAIIDLGCSNLGSVALAFERLGIVPTVTSDPATINACDRIVLPGVGAAGHAMARIRECSLEASLKSLEQPALGICLGMQLLFECSEEGDTSCLAVIPGEVRALKPAPGMPSPHMGWSRLEVQADDLGLASDDYVYFAHGFACDDGPATVARTSYGRNIPAVVRQRNWLGAQFHPERSGDAGARFLRAFLE